MKILMTLALLISSIQVMAAKTTIEMLAGDYMLMTPDEGLVVKMEIKRNGKVQITERFIGSGVKSVCDKARATMPTDVLMLVTAECKFRDGYANIGNKVSKTVQFQIDMKNVLLGNSTPTDDPTVVNYETTYASSNTNGKIPALLIGEKK